MHSYLRTANEYMKISTSLPASDIEKILELVRARTDEVIESISDGQRGPVIRTSVVYGYGHDWQIRRAPSGWKILQGLSWTRCPPNRLP